MGRLIAETTSSGGTVSYGYNELNLKEQLTNARGQVRRFFYDQAGRIVGYVGAEDSVSYTYDSNGNLLTVTDKNGTVTRTYDALNRVASCTDTFGKTISYEYDAVGKLSRLIYPDGTAVSYTYDANGNLISVTDWANRVTTYSYDVNNKVVGVVKPDGSVTTTVYDSAQRVVSTVEKTASGEVISGFEYTYDSVSRIVEEKHLAIGVTMCYTYDSLSRVTNRTIKNECNEVVSSEAYSYDAAGNVTQAPESCFVYDANNRLVEYNTNTTSYDADGNMTGSGAIDFEYDSANRLVKAGGRAYTYNAEDVRIRYLSRNEDTAYTYDTNCRLSQLLEKTTNGVVTKYVYGMGLIGEECEGEFKTYHFDSRGSTVAVTDESGVITDTFKYDTYGNEIEHIGESNIIFGYNGRDGVVTDKNTLIYMRARYYSPDMRRFVNADIIAGSISNAITLNRYAYANGNPVSFIDPFGLFPLILIPDSILKTTDTVKVDYDTESIESYRRSLAKEKIESAKDSAIAIGQRATIGPGTIGAGNISISMISEEKEIERISEIIGLEKTCDLIAMSACDKFLDEYGREFILSDSCVSKEILDHIEAYYWSTGKKLFPNYLASGFMAKRFLDEVDAAGVGSAISNYNAASVYEATKSIDMREKDIVKINNGTGISYYSSQAFLFNYKDGIRKEYLGTQYDPWANERK